MPAEPRPAIAEDLEWMHALNEQHAQALSSMTLLAFRDLVEMAAHVRVAGVQGAFLIGLDQDAAYDSPNFQWIKRRLPRFAYVDRVAVANNHRRMGLARALYLDLFSAARQAGLAQVACEVNLDPPNPGSDAFHMALGFQELGRQYLPDRDKTVRYLVCHLD